MKTRLLNASVVLAMVGVMVCGCSDRKHSAPTTEWLPNPGEVLRANTSAGGIHASYAAYFDKDKLLRITEVRKNAADETAGEYVFTEARLTQYKGAALHSAANIELTFDMHGVLISATPNTDAQEIAAIRTRAELLRSLVLARQTTRQHEKG